jgi:hypothetical protein
MASPTSARVARDASVYLAALSAAALTAVCLVAALLSAGALPSEPLPKTASETTIAAVSLVVVVGAAIVGWWLVEFRPRISMAICWLGLGSYLPELAVSTDLPVLARAVLLAALPLAILGAMTAATAWRTATATARASVWIAVGLSAAATTLHALAYDPFSDPGCWQVCEPIAPVITAVGLRYVLGLCALLTLLAACAAAVAIVSARPAPLPVRVAALSAVALIAIATAIPWLRWGSTAHTTIDDVLRTSPWPA